jgi:hypothetical protein
VQKVPLERVTSGLDDNNEVSVMVPRTQRECLVYIAGSLMAHW